MPCASFPHFSICALKWPPAAFLVCRCKRTDEELRDPHIPNDGAAQLPRFVYQNDWMLVVDKPAGMSYHSEFEDGVLKTVRTMQIGGAIPYDGELHSVHRLDRVTSGLLLFGKSKDAASRLSKAFEDRAIQKFYVAISDAKPIKRMGTVSGDMVKSRRSQWKLSRTSDNPAVTRFICAPLDLKESAHAADAATAGDSGARRYHVVLMRPLTGKTHQLRVALRALAAPIVGDPLYHPADPALSDRCPAPSRLHAQRSLGDVPRTRCKPPLPHAPHVTRRPGTAAARQVLLARLRPAHRGPRGRRRRRRRAAARADCAAAVRGAALRLGGLRRARAIDPRRR